MFSTFGPGRFGIAFLAFSGRGKAGASDLKIGLSFPWLL